MGSDSLVKVLIIDDDSTQHVLAKEYLGAAGFTVRIAEDGQRGLKLAATTSPNIILLDVVLPTIDGYAICKELKETPETANIPIVLVTASRDQDVIKRGLEAGATDFVTKPLDWEFLADRVKHVLHQHDNKAAQQPGDTSEAARQDAASLLEKDKRISVLEAALAKAENKISALNVEVQAATEQAAVQKPEPDWSDVQEQLGEIEKEWSVRLQDAVTQANKRADQRYQKLKTGFDNAARVNEDALLQVKRQLDLAEQDRQTLAEQKNELVEKVARQTELASLARQEAEQQRSELVEQLATLWEFVGAKTERQRNFLRDTQTGLAEMRKLAGKLPQGEEMHSAIDHVDMMLSAGAKEINKLRSLAVHSVEPAEVKSDTFRLKTLMDDVSKKTCSRAGRNDVRVTNGLSPGLEVTADREALTTVIQSLLENALQHSPPNGSVEVQDSEDQSGGLVLRITDHGFGIDSALLEEIRLFLNEPSTSVPANKKLSGSGLPMAKTIAQRHGGQVAIESALGEGTTVLLSLPIATTNEASAPVESFELRAVS